MNYINNDRQVNLRGYNDSTGELVHDVVSLSEIREFFTHLKNQLMSEQEGYVTFDCYESSTEVFGRRDKYFIGSVYLHSYDGGSFFGRVGFIEGRSNSEEVLEVIDAIDSVLDDIDEIFQDHSPVKYSYTFDFENWVFVD